MIVCTLAAFFLDLTKAFDTVDHQILLDKLERNYGIRGLALQLIESYLSNRQRYTKIHPYKSKLGKITCGVPQSSSLGPLLFLLYINDLPLVSQFDTTLFADDTYLTLSNRSLWGLELKANNELRKIDTWMRSNKLSLNYSKSCYMIINKVPSKSCDTNLSLILNSTPLKRQQTVKYPGLYVDETLRWSTDIQQLSLQLARYAGIFYRIRNLVPRETLRLLYHSLILSRIQYGILIWGNAAKIHWRDLSVRMNNIIRTITFSSKYCKMTILYQKLNILKVEDIQGLELAKYMHQLHNNKLPFSLFEDYVKLNEIHNHNTRQTQNAVYFKPRVNKSIGKELLVYRGAKLWENIDNSIKSLTWYSFKKRFKRRLISNYVES